MNIETTYISIYLAGAGFGLYLAPFLVKNAMLRSDKDRIYTTIAVFGIASLLALGVHFYHRK